jgi:hypothetical protein
MILAAGATIFDGGLRQGGPVKDPRSTGGIGNMAECKAREEEDFMIDPAVLEHIRVEGSRLIRVIEQHRRRLPSRYCVVVPDLIRIVTSENYIEDIVAEEETKAPENIVPQSLRLVK